MEILLNCAEAFAAGGFLCLIGQLLIDYTKLTPARILVGYVVAGVILTAAGIYKPFVDIFGAGATVPLTGFGYSLASGIKAAIDQNGFAGILSGPLSACAAGITSVMLFGFLAALISKPKAKR